MKEETVVVATTHYTDSFLGYGAFCVFLFLLKIYMQCQYKRFEITTFHLGF
jgi:hypothetical protein